MARSLGAEIARMFDVFGLERGRAVLRHVPLVSGVFLTVESREICNTVCFISIERWS